MLIAKRHCGKYTLANHAPLMPDLFAIMLNSVTAYFSHIFIDMFNKKDVQILFPLKRGFCFKLIYANGAANTVIMWIGFGITLLLIILKLFVLKK